MALQTFEPTYPPTTSSDKPELKILESEFGDGYTQAVGDGLNHIRSVVTLSWDWLDPTEADAIIAFLREHRGTRPFLYTLSDTEEPVQWTCKDWSRTRGTPHKIEATFRESFLPV